MIVSPFGDAFVANLELAVSLLLSQIQRKKMSEREKENHVSTCGIDFLRHSKRPTRDWREQRNNPSCKYRKKPYFSFFARRVGVVGGCDGI